ncbi:hypothetical protein BQ8482_130046 [Mesorhizobium delmotii]|uniref:Uncharacterized protein n=1 Tax=Mesorhizobium delmotii TaxID=1631247 RepID=A0A2P9AGB0_9HYPH|nr:hypothetical protein BQ8482_130046 [Mesorhizobium delmotii]
MVLTVPDDVLQLDCTAGGARQLQIANITAASEVLAARENGEEQKSRRVYFSDRRRSLVPSDAITMDNFGDTQITQRSAPDGHPNIMPPSSTTGP